MSATAAKPVPYDALSYLRANAAVRGDALAVHDEGEELSFEALHRAVLSLAADLRERGVEPGDVVAVALPNVWRYVALEIAVPAIGATLLPLPVSLGRLETEDAIERSGAKLVIGEERRARHRRRPRRRPVRRARPGPRRPDRADLRDHRPLEARLAHGAPQAAHLRGLHEPAAARARGPHAAALADHAGRGGDVPVRAAHRRGAGHVPPRALRRRALARARRAHQRHRARRRAHHGRPHAALARARRHRPLQPPRHDLRRRPAARRASPASGRSAPAAPVCSFYGAMDVGQLAVPSPDDPAEKRWTTVGKPHDTAELLICDPEGNAVEPGEEGEICMRGPLVQPRYWGEDETPYADDGWAHFGDLGRLDEDGFLHVTGRVKDTIIRGGSNINPFEVEDVLRGSALVQDVCVVGRPDEDLGERAVAFVVPAPGERADARRPHRPPRAGRAHALQVAGGPAPARRAAARRHGQGRPAGAAQASEGRRMTAARYEVGRGEPVVLVHGLGDDHRAWRRVVAPLMLTRRVVLYDLRGHGGSPLGDDADGSLAQLGSDLIEVLDDAGIERATIAGFSLGGTIAMRAAIDTPERVSALALIGTSSRVNSRRPRLVRGARRAGRRTTIPSCAPRSTRTPRTSTATAPRRSRPGCGSAASRRKIRAASPTPAWRWRASTRRRSTPSSAPSQQPTVIVAGDNDQHCPPRASEIIADKIGGSTMRVIEDTGHPLPVERPGRGRRRDRGGERLMGISISIGISPRESLADWSRFTGELEDRGVEELWLIDSQLAMKDAYIGLALAAQQTETMRLGTGVSNLITRHPTVTANGIAAIAELSGGRALLGLGAGDSAVYGLGARPVEGGRGGGGARVLRRGARRPRGHLAGPRLQARPGGPAHAGLPGGQPAAHVPPRRPARRRRDRHGPRAAGHAHEAARLDHRRHRGGRAQPRGRPRLLHRHAVGARGHRGRAGRRPLVGERAGAPAGERQGAAAEPRAVPRGDQARQGGLRLRRAPLDARQAPGHGQRRARAHARDLRHGRRVRRAHAGADGDRRRRPDLPAARRRAARAPQGADRADRTGGGELWT